MQMDLPGSQSFGCKKQQVLQAEFLASCYHRQVPSTPYVLWVHHNRPDMSGNDMDGRNSFYTIIYSQKLQIWDT